MLSEAKKRQVSGSDNPEVELLNSLRDSFKDKGIKTTFGGFEGSNVSCAVFIGRDAYGLIVRKYPNKYVARVNFDPKPLGIEARQDRDPKGIGYNWIIEEIKL